MRIDSRKIGIRFIMAAMLMLLVFSCHGASLQLAEMASNSHMGHGEQTAPCCRPDFSVGGMHEVILPPSAGQISILAMGLVAVLLLVAVFRQAQMARQPNYQRQRLRWDRSFEPWLKLFSTGILHPKTW